VFLIIVCRRYDDGMDEVKDGAEGSVAVVASVDVAAPVVVSASAEAKEKVRTTLEFLIKEIVDFPQDVSVRMWAGEQTTVYELTCRKEDIGKVIGKQGKTVSALREILRSLTGRIKLRAILDVKE